jgi:hypothetical protein
MIVDFIGLQYGAAGSCSWRYLEHIYTYAPKHDVVMYQLGAITNALQFHCSNNTPATLA